jgi:NAD(P)-dependent dehydrogenase (short-subunit alcohol dehydrogenase family)
VFGLSAVAALLVRADVTDETSVAEAIDEVGKNFGRVEGLVHLVGAWRGGATVEEHDRRTWDSMIGLNLTSAFHMTRAVLPNMKAGQWGRIVLVSSRTARHERAQQCAYAVAKAGVAVLAETIAEECRGTGVTANVVAPSALDTPANRKSMPDADHGKWVPPEDVAATISFLCSEEAGQLRGAWLPVYGGV